MSTTLQALKNPDPRSPEFRPGAIITNSPNKSSMMRILEIDPEHDAVLALRCNRFGAPHGLVKNFSGKEMSLSSIKKEGYRVLGYANKPLHQGAKESLATTITEPVKAELEPTGVGSAVIYGLLAAQLEAIAKELRSIAG